MKKLYINISNPLHEQDATQGQLFSWVLPVWILSFLSPRTAAKPRLKNQVCPNICHIYTYLNELEFICMHAQLNGFKFYFLTLIILLYIDLRPDQTCHSKDGGSAYSIGMGELGWQYGDRVKIPRYSHRRMRLKRVTIKHAIPKTGEVTHSDGPVLGRYWVGDWTII